MKGKALERLAADRAELSCVGQQCEERDSCVRYLRKAASFQQAWASFDIERQQKGDCPAIERI